MKATGLIASIWFGALACQSMATEPPSQADGPVSISIAVGGVT